MQQFRPPAGPLMQHTGNTTETCLYGINPIYHHVPRLCYSHPPPTFIISQLPLHPVYFFPGWPKSGAGFGGLVGSVDFAVEWGQRTLWFLILFLFKEQVRTLVEAALINSEINKEGCSYAFLQMCRRFIDRLWAVQYFYLCIVPLSFPKWGVMCHPTAAFDLYHVTFTPFYSMSRKLELANAETWSCTDRRFRFLPADFF